MNIKNEKLKASLRSDRRAKSQNEQWDLRLYIAGESPKAGIAFSNLKLICEERLKGKYHIRVIDLVKHPRFAREEQILAIPTLYARSLCRSGILLAISPILKAYWPGWVWHHTNALLKTNIVFSHNSFTAKASSYFLKKHLCDLSVPCGYNARCHIGNGNTTKFIWNQ